MKKEVISIEALSDLNFEVGKLAYNFPRSSFNELLSANI